MSNKLRAIIALVVLILGGAQAFEPRVQVAGPTVILFVALGILIPSATIYFTAEPKWLAIAGVISFALLVFARFSSPTELPALLVVPAAVTILLIVVRYIRQGRYTMPLIDPREKTDEDAKKE